ncbi:MAG: DUF2203 family protein [Planctomycetia bacterium]|nr:DUF2203 family protein [Planctomycetia bacterium]
MSGFTENRTPSASEHAGAPARLLTWQAAKAMLPLVGRVAADVAAATQCLGALRTEQACLDELRRCLDWPRRQRLYELEEELRAAEANLRQVMGELDSLGVTLLDATRGLIGFPTMVNQRRAFFSWQPGEENLEYWQYAGELARRQIPSDWITNPPKRITPMGNSRRGR